MQECKTALMILISLFGDGDGHRGSMAAKKAIAQIVICYFLLIFGRRQIGLSERVR